GEFLVTGMNDAVHLGTGERLSRSDFSPAVEVLDEAVLFPSPPIPAFPAQALARAKLDCLEGGSEERTSAAIQEIQKATIGAPQGAWRQREREDLQAGHIARAAFLPVFQREKVESLYPSFFAPSFASSADGRAVAWTSEGGNFHIAWHDGNKWTAVEKK